MTGILTAKGNVQLAPVGVRLLRRNPAERHPDVLAARGVRRPRLLPLVAIRRHNGDVVDHRRAARPSDGLHLPRRQHALVSADDRRPFIGGLMKPV